MNPSSRPTITSAVGLYQFSPAKLFRPTCEAEIVRAVNWAVARGLRVKAIGALHSLIPLPATEGACLVLDEYDEVLDVTGHLVTVQSGMRLGQLNEHLADRGLALPTLGTIAQQSVAGAISTGTHGGSLHRASLSGYVQAMRIVRADGSVIEVDRDRDELFDAVAISLGALGIISTVTFRCVPAFSLQTEVRSFAMPDFLHRFDEIHRQHQYADMRYSPICDRVHAALMNPTLAPLSENGGWQPMPTNQLAQALGDRVNKLAQRLFQTHRVNWLQKWGFERYDRTVYATPYGRSDFVLTHFDATSTDLLANEERHHLEPVGDMEVAVDCDRAPAALAALRDYFQTTRQFPAMHVHIRTQAAEPFWLSPTCGHPICWIEFWEYPRTGKFLRTMTDLLAPFNPRGHWGKQLPTAPEGQYAKWTEFQALRQQWDPQGTFANAYLDEVLTGGDRLLAATR